jgi:hypothetical protein
MTDLQGFLLKIDFREKRFTENQNLLKSINSFMFILSNLFFFKFQRN